MWIWAVAGLIAVCVAGLAGLRRSDRRVERQLAARLMEGAQGEAAFCPRMLTGIPEPAARMYRFVIAEGTPLQCRARIEMEGWMDFGSRHAPAPRPMTAWQVLAPPRGFVWSVRLRGTMGISGSDALTPATSWSRFRLLGVVPVGRAGGDEDHRLSSFGRMVAEAMIWTPAVFLPEARAGWDDLQWTVIDNDRAAVTVQHDGMEQTVEVQVDAHGQPTQVVMQRWSNENPDRVFRRQPFGGELSDFTVFGGYRLARIVRAGNQFGTDAYHAFYQARVTAVEYR